MEKCVVLAYWLIFGKGAGLVNGRNFTLAVEGSYLGIVLSWVMELYVGILQYFGEHLVNATLFSCFSRLLVPPMHQVHLQLEVLRNQQLKKVILDSMHLNLLTKRKKNVSSSLFPFMSSNILSIPAYARCCSDYSDFL